MPKARAVVDPVGDIMQKAQTRHVTAGSTSLLDEEPFLSWALGMLRSKKQVGNALSWKMVGKGLAGAAQSIVELGPKTLVKVGGEERVLTNEEFFLVRRYAKKPMSESGVRHWIQRNPAAIAILEGR